MHEVDLKTCDSCEDGNRETRPASCKWRGAVSLVKDDLKIEYKNEG